MRLFAFERIVLERTAKDGALHHAVSVAGIPAPFACVAAHVVQSLFVRSLCRCNVMYTAAAVVHAPCDYGNGVVAAVLVAAVQVASVRCEPPFLHSGQAEAVGGKVAADGLPGAVRAAPFVRVGAAVERVAGRPARHHAEPVAEHQRIVEGHPDDGTILSPVLLGF